MGGAVSRRVILAVLSPVPVEVPIEETNQFVVNLIEETPDPVHPERLKSLDCRTAQPQFAALQVRLQPVHAAVGYLFIDVAVLCEGKWAADSLLVRFVPHAPVPIPDNVTAPLFNAAADDIAAPIGKLLN